MVMNTPGGNTVSTAQLAVTLLCAAARRISEADASMKAVSALSYTCNIAAAQWYTLTCAGDVVPYRA
jgi:lactate dehydrogenase-like 2-hydroxyacid dehydrogenase